MLVERMTTSPATCSLINVRGLMSVKLIILYAPQPTKCQILSAATLYFYVFPASMELIDILYCQIIE